MAHGGDRYRNKIKYDFSVNINPDGLYPEIRTALEESIRESVYYPDPEAEKLGSALAKKLGVKREQILFGNGASELIMALIHGLKPKKILVPVPSFTGYEHAAAAEDAEFVRYEMQEGKGFVVEEDLADLITCDIGLVILTNPNNPTGRLIDPEVLNKILVRCGEQHVPIMIDECFSQLSDDPDKHSLVKELDKWPELMILRAFTKSFAMPGVRLGYLLCADPKKAERIGKHIPEWNLSIYAERAGTAALGCAGKLPAVREDISREREFLKSELSSIGFHVIPSNANYLLFHTGGKAPDLYEKLLASEVLIRKCDDYKGLPAGYFRIAVKDHESNAALTALLKEIVKKGQNNVK